MKYAVRLIKNTFHPLEVQESTEIEPGQMVLVLTEKGEEAFKVFAVNSEIAAQWEKFKPETLKLIRVLTSNDLKTLEELKKTFGKALALAVNIEYICDDTIKIILSKAGAHEKALDELINKEEIENNQEGVKEDG